jgi:aryl-alcohol dehydrogenase-like predicted oxidoreductase
MPVYSLLNRKKATMQYANLGRTGCKVSRLCLGTMNFGPRTTEPDSHAILSKGLELGMNFWDSANVYGGKMGEGVTERIIGNWFAANPEKRDQIVLATKYQGGMGKGPNDKGGSAFHIRQACEGSLKRLQTDHLDLYQMHHINRDCPWEEVYQALDTLRIQGKIIYAGSSNYAGWHIASAVEAARRLGVLGIVSEQSKYSLACRHIELEVLPACRHYGVAVIPWSPLGGGLLGGVLGGEKGERRASEGMQNRIAAIRPQLEKWEGFCRELGETPADVALAWMLNVPGITAPIIGPRTMEQLTGAVRALEIKLNDEQMKQLDEIWPSQRGPEVSFNATSPFRYEAPEAYAW